MSNTLFIGKVYHRFDELPSTNDWAAELLAPTILQEKPTSSILHESKLKDLSPPLGGFRGGSKTRPPEGTVVRAANQTAGRGQLGSKWQSAHDENLLLSVILYPTWLEVQAQFYLSMAVALALRDAIAPPIMGGPGGAIKWPNDLYLGGKKTAGILIQNSLSGAYLQSSIVGIGLNVNQVKFPEDLPNATSLAHCFGQAFVLDEVADRLFECLERRYLQLKAGHRVAIKAEYEENLWRRGQAARFVRNSDGSEFEGVILGVSETGMLEILTPAGALVFEAKAVSFRV